MKKRLASLFLALALCLGLCVPVLAAETADEIDPSLRLIAELIADWDESYELPDLDALSPEDRETVKALVDAILLAREAQPETEPESVPETEPEAQPEPETQPELVGSTPTRLPNMTRTSTRMPMVRSAPPIWPWPATIF